MMPESLDTQLTIYPRKIEGSDNWIVVLELGGIDGVSEEFAIGTVKVFDQLLPKLFEPMLKMATGMMGDNND